MVTAFYTLGKPGWEKLTYTTLKGKLGDLMFIYPNRWFVKVLAGEAITAGLLCEAPAADAAQDLDLNPASAAAAAATTVTLTIGNSAITADQFANGFLIVNDVDEEGHQYLIKSHPAGTSTSSVIFTLDEEAGLATALTTNSQCGLHPNPYNSVLIYNTTPLSYPVGVAPVDIASGEYGWLQIKGPATALIQGTPAIGAPLGASRATTGALALLDYTTTAAAGLVPIGAMGNAAGANGEYGHVTLNIGLV